MKNLDIRVKRARTETKDSTFEALERFASVEGRSIANALESILDGRSWVKFQEFRSGIKNPGKAKS